jgi:acyl CoA:acetate/3-ketoacid CoA transferase beta subunit
MTALAGVVVLAAAEAFRGDGEIFASGMGTIQMLAARTARATFEPDLLISDGEAIFVEGVLPIGGTDKVVAAWIPFRSVFDTVWSARRHVMMGASQIDRFGNSNIANIGPFARPTVQLLGVRGGPGNTISHAMSFFIPKHSTKIFVDKVAMLSGLGYDRVATMSDTVRRHHRLPRVETNLAVLDFETPTIGCGSPACIQASPSTTSGQRRDSNSLTPTMSRRCPLRTSNSSR